MSFKKEWESVLGPSGTADQTLHEVKSDISQKHRKLQKNTERAPKGFSKYLQQPAMLCTDTRAFLAKIAICIGGPILSAQPLLLAFRKIWLWQLQCSVPTRTPTINQEEYNGSIN